MKECPKCKELLGDNVITCFNCHYNFSKKCILGPDEIKQEKLKQEEISIQMAKTKEDLKKVRVLQLSQNPLFEYELEYVNNNSNRTIDNDNIKSILNHYSSRGWRLHTIFTNEVSEYSAYGSVSLSKYISIN